MYIEIISKDGYGENIIQQHEVEKKIYPKGIVYKYKDEYSENRIYVYSKKIKILRKGTITTEQIFEMQNETDFFYETPYMKKKMKIKTEQIEIKKDQIKIKYVIYENNEIVNKINIKILEKY